MKYMYDPQQLFYKLYATIIILLLLTVVAAGQQTGVWEKYEVKEKMTNLQDQKARCLPNCSFSAKSDDMGMTYEFNYYSDIDRKKHVYRGHVAWEWKNSKGPGTLVPGEKVTIKGVISNLSSEAGGVTAYATLGSWGFMKPLSGKSKDVSAPPNGTTVMTGTFDVPKEQGRKPDGTIIPYLNLTFLLSGGNEQKFIERTIVYKWTPINKTTQPVTGSIQVPSSKGMTGGEMTISYSGLPGNTTDWIGLYAVTAADNKWVSWQYTNGKKSGSMTFKLPDTGGQYEFRSFSNNGYTLVCKSGIIEVSQSAQNSPSIKLPATLGKAGSEMTITFSGFPGNARDWIGLYAVSATDKQWVSWQYTNGKKNGTMAFKLPSAAGNYEFRSFANDGYTLLCKISFTVQK